MSTLLPDLRTGIRQAPMLKAALPFMAGLMIGRGLALAWSTTWILVVIALLGALLPAAMRTPHTQRWWRVPAISMAWCALGMLWWMLRDPFPAAGSLTQGDPKQQLVELGEPGFRTDRTVQFDAVMMATPSVPHARLLLTIETDSLRPAPVTGDRLWIECEPHAIDRVPDPGGFDRRTYAATRGIALEAFVPGEDWRLARHVDQWTDVFASARGHVAHWLEQSGLPQRERALANALLLGIRDELEQDQKMAFARSGTMHVLAVSGMHVALIWAVLSILLAWWGNKTGPRYVRGVVILLALWAYAGLTGAPPSVLRATVMCTLFTVGGMVLRSSGHLNSLFASALVLLIWILMLWQLSFQLSFLAVLGIILFYKPLLHLWEPPNRVLYYIWSAATVSVAAQLTTTPLSMFVFKSFPVWFLPANIVVVGMVSLAVYGGVLLLIFFKIPYLGVLTTWGMTQLLLFLGWSTAFFAALPGAYPGVRIDLAQCLLLYLFIGCAAAWITWGGRVLRWSAASTLLLVLVSWGRQAHQLDRTLRFTVHDRSDVAMASLQIGRELYLITDDTLGTGSWLERRIGAQQRATGADLRIAMPWEKVIGSQPAIRGAMVLGGGFVATRGLRVRSIDAEDRPLPAPVDVLILMRDGRYEMDEIMRGALPGHGVVLSPAISGSERFRIRSWCEQHQLTCHDVKRQGAFILETEL